MKNIWSLTSFVAAVMLSFGLSGCVSTETLEPENNINKKRRLVINLSTPEEANTRAVDSEYKLRYTAKLFSGSDYSIAEIKETKHLIEGEKGNGGVVNQLVFDVTPEHNYSFYIFADYIPESSEKSADGLYPDYYYDTTYGNDYIILRGKPNITNKNDAGSEFFDNDRYDCFIYADYFWKGEEEKTIDAVLQRAVAKVRFADTSKTSGNYMVKVSKVSYRRQYGFDNIAVGTLEPANASYEVTKYFSGEDNQEILSFYSFASKDLKENDKLSIKLTITKEGGESHTLDIDNIEINQNHITTVKGVMLPGSSGQGDNNEGNDPGTGDTGNDNNGGNGEEGDGNGDGNDDNKDNQTKTGPIYLNLSKAEGWSQELSYPWN